jgi:hypothetical protein
MPPFDPSFGFEHVNELLDDRFAAAIAHLNT